MVIWPTHTICPPSQPLKRLRGLRPKCVIAKERSSAVLCTSKYYYYDTVILFLLPPTPGLNHVYYYYTYFTSIKR